MTFNEDGGQKEVASAPPFYLPESIKSGRLGCPISENLLEWTYGKKCFIPRNDCKQKLKAELTPGQIPNLVQLLPDEPMAKAAYETCIFTY